jgi:guanine deaminase
VAVFCPTSNLFLGSGLFDYQRYRTRTSRSGSRPRPMSAAAPTIRCCAPWTRAYKVIALNGEKLNPFASYWQLTRGNAEALSIADKVGTLDVGTDADLVVLDARATPAMRLRMERCGTLAEELFLLQTLGDDRAVVEVYVAGKAAKTTMDQAA